MDKCRRICCEMPHCHLAFMLSSNCFSVACKSADACKTQGANPSRYNPKISYVRDFKTNALLGKRIHMLIICKQMKTIFVCKYKTRLQVTNTSKSKGLQRRQVVDSSPRTKISVWRIVVKKHHYSETS